MGKQRQQAQHVPAALVEEALRLAQPPEGVLLQTRGTWFGIRPVAAEKWLAIRMTDGVETILTPKRFAKDSGETKALACQRFLEAFQAYARAR